MSKGSNPRPLSIPRDQFAAQFDAIFKKCDHEYAWEPMTMTYEKTTYAWVCTKCNAEREKK